MEQEKSIKKELSLSSRIEVLVHLIMNKPFHSVVDGLSTNEVVAIQKFVWDKTVEIGLTDDVVVEIINGLSNGDVVITKMSNGTSAESEETGGLLDSVRIPGSGGGRK